MNASSVTELTVVRHGETEWNSIGRQQGHLDSPLTELGIAQAQAIAQAVADERFDALYSSDLGRAMRTAEIVGRRLGMQVIPHAGLRERHLGVMQGMTMAEFQSRHPDDYARFRGGDADYVIPGGESRRRRHECSVAAAREIAGRHAGQRIVVVTHGGVLQSLFRHVLGLDVAAPRRFSLYNAGINTFTVADGEWRLARWGDTHHLKGLGTMDDW